MNVFDPLETHEESVGEVFWLTCEIGPMDFEAFLLLNVELVFSCFIKDVPNFACFEKYGKELVNKFKAVNQ